MKTVDESLKYADDFCSSESYVVCLATEVRRLQKRMDQMTAERDHWKANHDYRVHAAKLLIDRPDCPLERVKAYKRHVELIADVESYVAINAELATELAKLREQEPVAFWWIGPTGKESGGPYSGAPSDEAVNNARNSGCKAHLLYADPVPAAPYGVDDEAANRIALAVYDCKNGINPEPLLYAINRILGAEVHPLSVEGRDALLQSAPQAPATPKVLREVMLPVGHFLNPHQITQPVENTDMPSTVKDSLTVAAPSVPEEWRDFVQKAKWYFDGTPVCNNSGLSVMAAALLQSSEAPK